MNKFTVGPKVKSMESLASLLEHSCWVYLNHKPYHPYFLVHMQFGTLQQFVKAGRVAQAIRRC